MSTIFKQKLKKQRFFILLVVGLILIGTMWTILVYAACGDATIIGSDLYLDCPEGSKYVGVEPWVWEGCSPGPASCEESAGEACCCNEGFPCKYQCNIIEVTYDGDCPLGFCYKNTVSFSDSPCELDYCSGPEPELPECQLQNLKINSIDCSAESVIIYPGETSLFSYFARATDYESQSWLNRRIRGYVIDWQDMWCSSDRKTGDNEWHYEEINVDYGTLSALVGTADPNVKVDCMSSGSQLGAWCPNSPYTTDVNFLECQIILSVNPETPHLDHSIITETSIQWTWEETRGATHYNLYDTVTDNFIKEDIEPAFYCIGGLCSWTESGLDTNTQYHRYIKAKNMTYGTLSDKSNPDSVYTAIEAVVSAVCTDIQTNQITVTAYSAGGGSFSNLLSGNSGIHFQRGSDELWKQAVSHTFTGLDSGMPYTLYAGPSRNGDDVENGIAQSTGVCATLGETPASIGQVRVAVDPSIDPDEYLKLNIINPADSDGDDPVRIALPGGIIGAADLVDTNDTNASPVRIQTQFGIKAWGLVPEP